MNVQTTFNLNEFIDILEPLIRRVVREELNTWAKTQPPMFFIMPHMPLYDDLLDIQTRKNEGNIELLTHDEVWV